MSSLEVDHFHGLVDPLCESSWDKWNRDKLHRGYRACPGTGFEAIGGQEN